MNLFKPKYFLFVFSLGFVISCKAPSKAISQEQESQTRIDFVESGDLDSAIKYARSQYKLLFLDMYTSWSEPCQIMKDEVYTDKEAAQFFNKNFVNYRIDAEKGEGPKLVTKYGVRDYPTLLILNARGEVIHRNVSAISPQDLIKFGKEGLEMSPTM